MKAGFGKSKSKGFVRREGIGKDTLQRWAGVRKWEGNRKKKKEPLELVQNYCFVKRTKGFLRIGAD